MSVAAGLVGGVAVDAALGDPRRGHPVAAFGAGVSALEARAYAPAVPRGVAVTAGSVVAVTLPVLLLDRGLRHPGPRAAASAVVFWNCLGGRSLWAIGDRLARHLAAGDLEAARALVPSLAGRDPSLLDASGIARAATESIAENTADAVLGTLVWGAALGPAGAVLHRAANTLDAMHGHRSPRYERFGWAAARLDDVLGFVPARIGAWLAVALAPIVAGGPVSGVAGGLGSAQGLAGPDSGAAGGLGSAQRVGGPVSGVAGGLGSARRVGGPVSGVAGGFGSAQGVGGPDSGVAGGLGSAQGLGGPDSGAAGGFRSAQGVGRPVDRWRRAGRVLRRDGRAHPSPNAGPMEAAFAGALGVRLGGPLRYGDRDEVRPTLGAEGRTPDTQGLRDAVRLSKAVSLATLTLALATRWLLVTRPLRPTRRVVVGRLGRDYPGFRGPGVAGGGRRAVVGRLGRDYPGFRGPGVAGGGRRVGAGRLGRDYPGFRGPGLAGAGRQTRTGRTWQAAAR